MLSGAWEYYFNISRKYYAPHMTFSASKMIISGGDMCYWSRIPPSALSWIIEEQTDTDKICHGEIMSYLFI